VLFRAHGVDASGKAILRRKLQRAEVLSFFEGLQLCLVGIEACSTAHHWAREIQALGHEVRLMPPSWAIPKSDAGGEVRISFCSYARWLNKFAFTAVSDLTSECRERLGGWITDFATSIKSRVTSRHLGLQSSAAVLANGALSCSNSLTMGGAACSHYLPPCSPSSAAARDQSGVLTLAANEFSKLASYRGVRSRSFENGCEHARTQGNPAATSIG